MNLNYSQTSAPQPGSFSHSGLAMEIAETPRSRFTRVLHLKKGAVISLGANDGVTRVRVVDGIVWLTDTPASGDYVLESGDIFELGNRMPWVIQGLVETALELVSV